VSIEGKFILFLLYTVSLLTFFNSGRILVNWVLIEFNRLYLFRCWLLLDKKINWDNLIFYYCIQAVPRLIFIMCYFIEIELNNHLLLTCLAIKGSLIPFHFWFYKISNFLENYAFCLLIVLQKIPVLVLFSTYFDIYFFPLILMNLGIRRFFIFYSRNSTFLLVSSSIFNVFWSSLIAILRSFLFLLFNLFYFLTLLLFCAVFRAGLKPLTDGVLLFSVLFLMSLPPTNFFFIKFNIVQNLMGGWTILSLLLIFGATLASFRGYLKYFYNFFFFVPKAKVFVGNLKTPFGRLLSYIRVTSSFFFLGV